MARLAQRRWRLAISLLVLGVVLVIHLHGKEFLPARLSSTNPPLPSGPHQPFNPTPYDIKRQFQTVQHTAFRWHDGAAPAPGPVSLSKRFDPANPNGTSELESSLFFDFHGVGPGLAVLNQKAQGFARKLRHPIWELMESAEKEWDRRVASQSKTLSQAAAEYQRRYGMPPPAGFDAWFAFAQQNKVMLVDEYDQMMDDVLPHYALAPATFRQRSRDLEGTDHTYTYDMDSDAGEIKLTGPRGTSLRPTKLRELLADMLPHMPKGFKLRVTGSDHDTSSDVLGADQRDRAMTLVQEGKHFTDAELKKYEDPRRNSQWGWFKACAPEHSAIATPYAHQSIPGNGWGQSTWRVQTFIYDHLKTMNFCHFPWHKQLHGAMSLDYEDRSKSRLKPALVNSKFIQDSSFQATPLEAYEEFLAKDIPSQVAWKDKTEDRVYWRGRATGGFNSQIDWRLSHRLRLHQLVNGPSPRDKALRTDWMNRDFSGRHMLMLPQGDDGFEYKAFIYDQLRKRYADVSLVGSAIQCTGIQAVCDDINEHVDFGEPVDRKVFSKYKYLLDVDGNGWSSRFHSLLKTGSVVLKMTAFPEWNLGWMVPWYHYVPLKLDYTDLYETMAFFVGPLREDETTNMSLNHDKQAQLIGERGQRFAAENWRRVDMQAYMYRLLLEIRRLESEDRQAMSYRS